MGKTFQNVHVCSVGNFENNGDKIPQWVRANGGDYSRDVHKDVTHLITTKDTYKKNVGIVKKAKKLGTIKIVSYDWLRDSLLSKSRKPKREGQYLFDKILKKKSKQEKEKEKKKKGKRSGKSTGSGRSGSAAKDEIEALGYHVYTDKDANTTYSATLVRPLISAKSKEKYQIKVYEFHTAPPTYTTHTKYTRIGKSLTSLLAGRGSNLEVAIDAFKEFFQAQTGKEWEDRLDGHFPDPKRDSNGDVLPVHLGWFQHEFRRGILASFLDQESNRSTVQERENSEIRDCVSTGAIHPVGHGIDDVGHTGDGISADDQNINGTEEERYQTASTPETLSSAGPEDEKGLDEGE